MRQTPLKSFSICLRRTASPADTAIDEFCCYTERQENLQHRLDWDTSIVLKARGKQKNDDFNIQLLVAQISLCKFQRY